MRVTGLTTREARGQHISLSSMAIRTARGTAGGVVRLAERLDDTVGLSAFRSKYAAVVVCSGRASSSGDLPPDGGAVGHHLSVVGRRQQVPTGPKVRRDAAERGQEPLRVPDRLEAFHRPLAVPGRLVRVLGAVEFSTDVKCCDDSGGRFMLVAERAMPWSA